MYRHGPTCLQGPVSRARRWWVYPTAAETAPENAGPRPRTDSQEIRADLVARVRLELAAGTYDTPQRWEAALDRLAMALT
jgi:hypothetical protein